MKQWANLKKAPQSHKVTMKSLILMTMVGLIGKVTFDYRSITRWERGNTETDGWLSLCLSVEKRWEDSKKGKKWSLRKFAENQYRIISQIWKMILGVLTVRTGLLYSITNRNMWRYYYNARSSTSDYPKTLTIKALKEYGLLDGTQNGRLATLKWSNGSNISIQVNIIDDTWTIRVYFTQTNRSTGEEKNMDYTISLIATPCNYGGKRWWLVCPLKWNKCTILYLQNNGWFGSRKTLNLCYDGQKESKKYRYLSYIMGWNPTKAIVLQRTIKYPYRNGKPTKKLERFFRLSEKGPTLDEVMQMKDTLFQRKPRKK